MSYQGTELNPRSVSTNHAEIRPKLQDSILFSPSLSRKPNVTLIHASKTRNSKQRSQPKAKIFKENKNRGWLQNTWITESIKFINICAKAKRKKKTWNQSTKQSNIRRESESTVSQGPKKTSSSGTVIFEDLFDGSRTWGIGSSRRIGIAERIKGDHWERIEKRE